MEGVRLALHCLLPATGSDSGFLLFVEVSGIHLLVMLRWEEGEAAAFLFPDFVS